MTDATRRITIAALTGVLTATEATWPSVLAEVYRALHAIHGDSGDSIASARASFFAALEENGQHCPVCTQWGEIYSHSVTPGLAKSLINLYRLNRPSHIGEWKTVSGGIIVVLTYFGLIRRPAGDPSRTFNRSGVWEATQLARDWIEQRVVLPKHVRVYDNRVLGWSTEYVTFAEALKAKWHPSMVRKSKGATP